MLFNENLNLCDKEIIVLTSEEQEALYLNSYRCPVCFIVPLFNLKLDDKSILMINITCKCGSKNLEINEFLSTYSRDLRGNIQCKNCEIFATKNNIEYKFCLYCKKFLCGNCKYDHITNENHTLIQFQDIGAVCPVHYIYNQAYCKNCHLDICKECYYNHRTHKIINYNSLYISDLEMEVYNTNYGKVQLNVLFKDTETKENLLNLLKNVDEFDKGYITELFDNNKIKNTFILKLFKSLLNVYNVSTHKTYNIIMNVRNNIGYNNSLDEIKIDNNMDINTLLNQYYLYAKNLIIARKPKPIKEKYEKIEKKLYEKTEIDIIYDKILQNIEFYTDIVRNENLLLNDGKEVNLQIPKKYSQYLYYGEFDVESFTPHGRGLLFYKNGERYYGNFENGKKSKLGIFFFKNSAIYEGEWKDNKMDGYGIYKYKNGIIYEGYFQQNEKQGPGILKKPNGDYYEGVFNKGNLTYGKIVYKDGKIYMGQLANYMKDSKGILYYPNGDIFIGNFNRDYLSCGQMNYANKDIYIGNFKNNKFDEFGIMYYFSKGEIYKGKFLNGHKHGIGKYIYNNGDLYQGFWSADTKNVYGIMKYHNGDWYEGAYLNDLRHGIGMFYQKQGDEYYVGEWIEDLKNGIATYYTINWCYQLRFQNNMGIGHCILYQNKFIFEGEYKEGIFYPLPEEEDFPKEDIKKYKSSKKILRTESKNIPNIKNFSFYTDFSHKNQNKNVREKEKNIRPFNI